MLVFNRSLDSLGTYSQIICPMFIFQLLLYVIIWRSICVNKTMQITFVALFHFLCFYKLMQCYFVFIVLLWGRILKLYITFCSKRYQYIVIQIQVKTFCQFTYLSSFQIKQCIFCFFLEYLRMHLQVLHPMFSSPSDRYVTHTELTAFFLTTEQIYKSI